MSAYEAKQLRTIAREIADGERKHTWPWHSVIFTYLGAGQFGRERYGCPHRVMACLLAAQLAQSNRRGNWHDYRAKQPHK